MINETFECLNFEYFLYMSVNYMRKHQWTKTPKREIGTRRPTFDLHNILQRSQGERNGLRRDHKSEYRGRSPKEQFREGEQSQREIHFSIDFKGGEIETLMRSDDHTGRMIMSVVMSKCFHQCWCFHQCQRGRFLESWFRQLVVIDVNPWRLILYIYVNA
jgi:hypothetical protein